MKFESFECTVEKTLLTKERKEKAWEEQGSAREAQGRERKKPIKQHGKGGSEETGA